MTGAERGFLLLSSQLGNPQRRVLSAAAMRRLAMRVRTMDLPVEEREIELQDLLALGYGRQQAQQILDLLGDEMLLDLYLQKARQLNCLPITRISPAYPCRLRERLADESPGVLWAKGDVGILNMPMIALVGSRDILPDNKAFAASVGKQAAKQGYALVSGNARGADKIAQKACLHNGGYVISVVADVLSEHSECDRVLYLSEEDFDASFSAQRALSRNRVIHAFGEKTFVAQCTLETGGTWDGTVKNLRHGWSPVFCFADGSPAVSQLEQMGAVTVDSQMLYDFSALEEPNINFLTNDA